MYTESYIWDNTHGVGASTTLISLSFYAHYPVSIHFLPKLFGTCHLFVILNIQCKFRLILWELIFFFLPELEFTFKGSGCGDDDNDDGDVSDGGCGADDGDDDDDGDYDYGDDDDDDDGDDDDGGGDDDGDDNDIFLCLLGTTWTRLVQKRTRNYGKRSM